MWTRDSGAKLTNLYSYFIKFKLNLFGITQYFEQYNKIMAVMEFLSIPFYVLAILFLKRSRALFSFFENKLKISVECVKKYIKYV